MSHKLLIKGCGFNPEDSILQPVWGEKIATSIFNFLLIHHLPKLRTTVVKDTPEGKYDFD